MLGGHRMCRVVKAAGGNFPASLPFTTWLLDYSATPWEGEDSAGTSGTRDLVAPSGSTYPSAGPTLNGHATGAFNGTTMAGQFGATLDEVLGNDDYSFGIVAYVPTPPTDSGLYYANRAIFATAGIYYAQLFVRSSGVVTWSAPAGYAVSASGVRWNSWNFFQVRRVGSTGYIRVNGGSWSSSSMGDFENVSKVVRLGITSGGAYLKMDLAQFWTAKEAVSTDDFDLLLAYVRTLYGLTGSTPTITSLNYAQGDTAGGGQSIVITGTNLTGATEVTFLGTAATSYTVDSDTQITAVLPAHAAGTGVVQVKTPALGGVATIAFEYWGPSAASAYWQADYAGSPWEDVIGSADLAEATNAPSVGTTVNGFDPADFDGTNDKLTSTSAASSFMSTSAYTGWALVRVRTASAGGTDYTDIYSRDGIVGSASNAQDWGVGVRSDNTVGVYHYGGGNFDGVTVGITLNSWQLVQWKYDGTNLKLRVNGGSWGSIAKGSVASLAQSVLVGESQVASTEYADMLMMSLGLDSSAWSDAELDKLRLWAKQRFGLSV